jgi:hypothetical protein
VGIVGPDGGIAPGGEVMGGAGGASGPTVTHPPSQEPGQGVAPDTMQPVPVPGGPVPIQPPQPRTAPSAPAPGPGGGAGSAPGSNTHAAGENAT